MRHLAFIVMVAAAPLARAEDVEQFVVSATRTRHAVSDVGASTTVITGPEVRRSGALTADDLLRQVPDFNTFRRSSAQVISPAEDPEAQGVTLRGIGPGGASRALVMHDGIPANDAFGGWLYWGELPLEDLDRVEIVRGAGSSLWGDFAEGGVIDFVTRTPARSEATLKLSGGTRGTTDDVLTLHEKLGEVRLGLSGRFFHTDGYPIVVPFQRGPIDQAAGSEHHVAHLRMDWDVAKDTTVYLKASDFDQDVDGGTPLRRTRVQRQLVATGARAKVGGGTLALDAFTRSTSLRQRFTEATPARDAEMPKLDQVVPSNDTGGSLAWTAGVGKWNEVTLGGDYRSVRGASIDDELDPTGTAIMEHRESGGKQTFLGLFVQDELKAADRLSLVLDARVDHFRNFAAFNPDGPEPDTTHTLVSPRAMARYRVRPGLAVRGGVYRGFRAPTLAELYRESEVEDLKLKENPLLEPESLEGGEVGADLTMHRNWQAHVTGFANRVRHPIANVVTAFDPVTGEDAARTRVNLGAARIRGVEAAVTARVSDHVSADLAFTHLQAIVLENPLDPNLEGKRLQQVPWGAANLGLSWHDAQTDVRLAGRFVGRQFEDSDNHDVLQGYSVWDLAATRRVGRHELFLAAQNLFDRAFPVDRGGEILKLGNPFLAQAGARLYF